MRPERRWQVGANVVVLVAPALDLLADLSREARNPYDLTGKKSKKHFVGLERAWQRMRARADLSDVRLHDLRHSFASMGVGEGKSLVLVRALLGYSVASSSPADAKGQELHSLEKDGKPMASQPSEAVVPKPGKRWRGAIMKLQFTAGSAAGKYRPTLALLSDPDDIASPDGASYTYTIVVE